MKDNQSTPYSPALTYSLDNRFSVNTSVTLLEEACNELHQVDEILNLPTRPEDKIKAIPSLLPIKLALEKVSALVQE